MIKNINETFGEEIEFTTVEEMAPAIFDSGNNLPVDGLTEGRDFEVMKNATMKAYHKGKDGTIAPIYAEVFDGHVFAVFLPIHDTTRTEILFGWYSDGADDCAVYMTYGGAEVLIPLAELQ